MEHKLPGLSETGSDGEAAETALESWKEIAAHLQRGIRTVKRWERSEGLPVHRHQHQARSSVYAYRSEIDAWRARRQPGKAAEPVPLLRRPLTSLAVALLLLLALFSTGNGPLVRPTGLVALAQEGTMTARRVPAGSDIAFYGAVAPSPDGRYITHVDRGALALRDLTTGESRLVKEPSLPGEKAEFSVISPDAKYIAYEWQNADAFDELRLIRIDGSTDRLLYRNRETAESIRPYAWTRDRRSLVVLARSRDQAWHISVVSVEDGSLKRLKSLDWRYAFNLSLSPDGRYIAYDLPVSRASPQSRDIFLLAADGSGEVALVEHPALDYGPVWAPDGNRIVFVSARLGSVGLWSIEVRDGKPRGNAQLATRETGFLWPLGFGGGAFLYGRRAPTAEIYTAGMDAETGSITTPPERVSDGFLGFHSGPAWSPDGRFLAYAWESPSFSAPAIVVRTMSTGEERSGVWRHEGRLVGVRWFPDGLSLLASAADAAHRISFYQVNAQTLEARPILRNATLARSDYLPFSAEVSADGKNLYYLHFKGDEKKPRSIKAYGIETGEARELYRVSPPLHPTDLALSGDGRKLAFVLCCDDCEGGKDSHSLHVMPAAGGKPSELSHASRPGHIETHSGLAWTPDGRYLVVPKSAGSKPGKHELWRIEAEGGAGRSLGLAMEGPSFPSVHPAGRQLVFSDVRGVGRGGGEVWSLSNFLPGTHAGDSQTNNALSTKTLDQH